MLLNTVITACTSGNNEANFFPQNILNIDTNCTQALIVDTSIQSAFVHKEMKFKVVLPLSYASADSLPVLYLLHGYGGDEGSYLYSLSSLRKVVNCLNVVVVCVDGDVSWYANSSIDKDEQYEDYMIKELLPFINKNFKVGKSNARHGIAGLSMGGFGSLYLAFKHSALFSYVGGSSACVDIKPYPENWGLKNIFGIDEKVYFKNSPYYMLDSIKKENLKFKLVLDCGKEDFFFEDNNRFNEKLDSLRIQHDYFVAPGEHDWQYWNVSIPAQIKMFAETVR